MRITREWIKQHGSTKNAWTRAQLSWLGVPWPPRKGWLTRLIGKEIDGEKAAMFEWHGDRTPVLVTPVLDVQTDVNDMGKYSTKLRNIPPALRHKYRLAEHMTQRPAGMPRTQWLSRWKALHGLSGPAGTPNTTRTQLVAPPSPPKAKKVSKRVTFAVSDGFLLSAEWRRLRMLVITKRGARCECCGASPKDGVTVINVDHIKPRRLFPQLALVESNLQILCAVCNHGKGNWDQTDWRRDAPVEPVTLEPEALTYEELRPLWWPRLVKTN